MFQRVSTTGDSNIRNADVYLLAVYDNQERWMVRMGKDFKKILIEFILARQY